MQAIKVTNRGSSQLTTTITDENGRQIPGVQRIQMDIGTAPEPITATITLCGVTVEYIIKRAKLDPDNLDMLQELFRYMGLSLIESSRIAHADKLMEQSILGATAWQEHIANLRLEFKNIMHLAGLLPGGDAASVSLGKALETFGTLLSAGLDHRILDGVKADIAEAKAGL